MQNQNTEHDIGLDPAALSDPDLVTLYARSASAMAYGEIVARHGRMVYQTALRVLGDQHDAEDAAQTVFLIFARRAEFLGRETVLGGWLYRTSWFVAKIIQRKERLRKSHVKRASEEGFMRQVEQPANEDWAEVRDQLDAALNALPEKSRTALVLHYLEGQTLREVGMTLGCSEDAARKRVAWALSKLRGRLRQRGVAIACVALASGLAVHGAEASDAGVMAKLQACCIPESALKLSAEKGSLVQEVIRIMWIRQIKVLCGYGMAAVLCLATLSYAIKATIHTESRSHDVSRQSPSASGMDISGERGDSQQEPVGPKPATKQPGFMVRGVVLDSDGRPLAGAYVYASNEQPFQTVARSGQEHWLQLEKKVEPVFDYGPKTFTRTDSSGKYEISGILPPIGGSVSVYHPDYAVGGGTIQRNAAGTNNVVDIEPVKLTNGISVVGRVIAGDESSVPSAYVAVQPRIHFDQDHWPAPYSFGLGEVRLVRSDSKGEFIIRGLKHIKGGYLIAAWKDGVPPVEQTIIPRESNSETIVLKLKSGKPVLVRAVSLPDRKPIPGAHVWVSGVYLLTDATGTCRIDGLPQGVHWVNVSPPDQDVERNNRYGLNNIPMPPFSVNRQVEAGSDVTVELYPWFSMGLKVVDASTGKEIERFSSKFNGEREEICLIQENLEKDSEISGIRPGPWKWSVLSNGYFPQDNRLDIPMTGPKEVLVVSLQPGQATLRGRVIDQQSSLAIGGVKVSGVEWASFGATNHQECLSAADGSFELRHLLGDSYPVTLSFDHANHVGCDVEVKERKDKTLNDIQEGLTSRNQRFRTQMFYEKGSPRPDHVGEISLLRNCRVRGFIHGPDGKPVSQYGVAVYPQGANKNTKENLGYRGATGKDGRFEITLPPGSYDLQYGHQDWHGEQLLKLQPGDVKEMDLESDGSLAKEEF